MTAIMSNTAVSNVLIPDGISLALGIGTDPHTIMAINALSTSCAFMVPISKPPNVAVFASDYITIDDMVKADIGMNIPAVSLISAFVVRGSRSRWAGVMGAVAAHPGWLAPTQYGSKTTS
jgi:sodium-dependent dicarboxylate transporter 2/3/5